MTRWINVKYCRPPYDMPLLLYVIEYTNSDKVYFDDLIVMGYSCRENNEYYLEVSDNLDHEQMIEDELTQVIAWAIPPEITKKLRSYVKIGRLQ